MGIKNKKRGCPFETASFSYGYDLDDLYRYLLFNSSVGHNPNDGYHQVYDKTYDGIYQAVLDTNAVKYQR